MLIDKLREYYGLPAQDQAEYIAKRTLSMTEAQQNEIAQKIIEERAKRFGFPDISILAKYLNDAHETKKGKRYYWSVCDDCKTEYDYKFTRCPKCHLEGKHSSGYKVRASEYPPPMKVIRWNMTTFYPEPGKTFCITCAHRDTGYCRWFGNPDHTCPQSDYEYCECRKCCAIHKRGNAKAMEAARG